MWTLLDLRRISIALATSYRATPSNGNIMYLFLSRGNIFQASWINSLYYIILSIVFLIIYHLTKRICKIFLITKLKLDSSPAYGPDIPAKPVAWIHSNWHKSAGWRAKLSIDGRVAQHQSNHKIGSTTMGSASALCCFRLRGWIKQSPPSTDNASIT